MSHGLIKELEAKKRRALCVVIGVVKTTKPTSITADLDLKVKADAKVSQKAGIAKATEFW